MARKISLLAANFRSWSGSFQPEAVTTIHISAPFEQVVADQFGVKERIYKRRSSEDEPGVTSYGLDIDWIGATLTVKPRQGSLFGKSLSEDGESFHALRMYDFKIRRHKDDEQQLVSFNVAMLDKDAAMHQLLHAVRKDAVDIDIKPPSQKSAKEALAEGQQAGLFPVPKEKRKKDDDEEEEEGTKVVDE